LPVQIIIKSAGTPVVPPVPGLVLNIEVIPGGAKPCE